MQCCVLDLPLPLRVCRLGIPLNINLYPYFYLYLYPYLYPYFIRICIHICIHIFIRICICIFTCSTVAWLAGLCVSADSASPLISTNRLKHEFSTFGKVHIQGLIWLYQLFPLPLWPNNANNLDKYSKNTWQIGSRGAAAVILLFAAKRFLRQSLSIKCYH